MALRVDALEHQTGFQRTFPAPLHHVHEGFDQRARTLDEFNFVFYCVTHDKGLVAHGIDRGISDADWTLDMPAIGAVLELLTTVAAHLEKVDPSRPSSTQ